MYSGLKGTQSQKWFEMQGGLGGRIINEDICILQSMEVVLLNQGNIDSWIFFSSKKENRCKVYIKWKLNSLTSFSIPNFELLSNG